MAPVRNAIARWLAQAVANPPPGASLDVTREAFARAAIDLAADAERATQRAAASAASLLAPGATVITHSLS